jgi:hypothetical protein
MQYRETCDDNQYNNGELAKYKKMIKHSKKPLYHVYMAQYTRLFTMMKLFQLKASNGWSDCSFKDLLTLLNDMLPQANAVPENVCDGLLGTLLNTDRKTMDHGHAQADLKKMGNRQELCLDDLIKETELPTPCITLSKHEEFCGFLKNVKVPSGYPTNVSSLFHFQI